MAVLALVASLAVALPGLSATAADSGIVKAAPVVGFNAENIISDTLFYDGNAMSAAQIQTFLDGKIGSCSNGLCLNVLTLTADSRPAYYSQTTGNLVCSDLAGGTMRASEYIYRVQVACGISAKVILVTMQKEQGLVTDSAPTDTQLRKAMGHLCSDSAPCVTAASGIANQIFGGTEQLKKYKATAFGKQPGPNWVGYHPPDKNGNDYCGGTTLNIRNYATAALYNYTPYQPNPAALSAGQGLGDACSSYGNRNFYTFYTSWFGSTQENVDPCRAPAPSAVTPASGEYVTTDLLNGRAAPTTDCPTILNVFSPGTAVTRVATYGSWTNIRLFGIYYWVSSAYLSPAPAPGFTTDRVQGADRYETAAAIAAQTNPQGSATVYVVSGEDFADSVIGATVAARTKSALLLTGSVALPPATASRLQSLKPSHVIILGGPDAISAGVSDAIQQVVGAQTSVDRISGVDRYETARRVVASGWQSTAKVFIAAGAAFPDALSATSVAAAQGVPVLLVDGQVGQIPQITIELLRQLGVTTVVLAGGPQALSAGIEAQLKSLGISVQRVGGEDRYATSLGLAQQAYPGSTPRIFMASGAIFPDALAGSVLSAGLNAPMILQPDGCMTSPAKDYANSHRATRITLLGGPNALSDAVARAERC